MMLAANGRCEAERHGSEAKGLVEFMLTDLRTDLKGVGSLELIETVNWRAVAWHRDQRALGAVSGDGPQCPLQQP